MAIEVFKVEWTKVFPFDKALTQSASQEGGIYIMYKKGRSDIATLFYIGMSKDFQKRFGTHRNAASHMMTDADLKKCFVNFGIVTSFETSHLSHSFTTEQLHDLESYLINEVKPIGNSDSTKKGYKGLPIVVFNTGTKSRHLNKVMSSCSDLVKLLKAGLR
jgi:hypothetical protein